ncbi:MAG: LutC/YkgG family protein [Micromonosporaceae bacterium]
MNDPQVEILERIRSALVGAPDAPEADRTYQRAHHMTNLVKLFAARVADYQATVHRVAPADLPSAVAEALAGSASLAVPADVPAGWLADYPGVVRRDDPPLPVDVLDATDAVLTGAALGIAETGTVVLDAGAHQGRRALTLIPDRHVCVVRADQVVADVPDAITQLDPVRPLTWISGPSATSDIELDRVEGVHGPRTLVVLLVSAA